MKRAIIVVPGICGSKLYAAESFYYENKRIKLGTLMWIKPSVFDVIDGDMNSRIRALNCTIDGTPEYPTECAAISKKEYGTVNTYEELIKHLRKAYRGVYEVVFFSYDWRYSCAESAKSLEAFIRYRKYEKVILVAHSLGGLVCTEYIKNGNHDLVDKLITLGTPHLGTPKALYIFETGCFFDSIADHIFNDSIKMVCGNFQSVYELLPGKQYFEFEKDHYVQRRIGNNTMTLNSFEDTSNLLMSRDWCKGKDFLKKAGTFLDDIYSSGILDSIDLFCICGSQVSTLREITMRYDMKGNFIGVGDLKMGNGDGTVVLHSANINMRAKKMYIAENITHSGLVKSGEIMNIIMNMIDGDYQEEYPQAIECGEPERYLKVEFDMPVDFEIIGNDGHRKHEPVYFTGSQLDNRMVFLPPGEYDIKVKGKGYNCRISHDGCKNGICSRVNLYQVDEASGIWSMDNTPKLIESLAIKD